MPKTMVYSDTLTVLDCGVCHISFAIPQNLYRKVLRDGSWFWCPNGDKIHYFETENARLKAELDQAQADARFQRDEKNRQRERAEAVERTNVALKGHLTRYRKRVALGVCPVAGCHRHFPNVQSHVETVHGEWLADHPEVFT